MSVEATSSDARKAGIRERSQERIQEQQDRLAEATNEAETKKQAMRNQAAQDAVKVELSSSSK